MEALNELESFSYESGRAPAEDRAPVEQPRKRPRANAQQQAAELGEFGIRANCVAPGPVRTKLAMAVHSRNIIDAYHDAIPLNRYGSEDEIAAAVIFLASARASYITGQCLAADGGFESTGVGLPALRR